LEGGLREPTPELLERIAEVLRYRVAFFSQFDDVRGMPERYHRKRQSVTSTALRQIHAELNIRRFHLARLLKAAQIDREVLFPELDVEDYNGSPEEVARAVRSLWQLPSGPVRNMMRSIEAAGGIVVPCDFGVAEVDAIAQRVFDFPPIIYYNPSIPSDRLRFTLAHELGHLIMHRLPHPKMEPEADRFAAEFLMPERDIRPQFGARVTIEIVAAMKPVWKVAVGALIRRARDVGKIDDATYTRLYKELSRRGYLRREPAELDFPPEKPTILPDLIVLHLNDLGYSEEELSTLFGIYRDEFLAKYNPPRARPNLIAL
nr:ImmA/IrrE family metallo-endopeptidase [Gemmatimonadota bacterium]